MEDPSRPQFNPRLDLVARMLHAKKLPYIEKVSEDMETAEKPAPCFLPDQSTKSQLPVLSATTVLPVSVASPMAPGSPPGPAHSPSSRPHYRPAYIHIRQSNGRTALTTAETKQRICDTRDDTHTTIAQIPVDKREKLPPTPTKSFDLTTMGNKTSSIAASPGLNERSTHPIPRSTKPVSRKSSFKIFKRVESRSPLPDDVTASVMSVMQQARHRRQVSTVVQDDDSDDDDNANSAAPVGAICIFDPPEKYGHRPLKSHMHSLSATTITEARARQPLSASTTIRDFRFLGQGNCDIGGNEEQSKPSQRNACLSPTLPAPSPLPEDSPHKYGLRDKMDTPELPANPMILPKARRKSSGLEIFNEAKSLQSAASFLNGLSTSRRRAESAADTSTSSWTALNAPSRPSSTRPPSARPSSGFQDGEGRRNGHNFKSSGFAYTRPLTLTQIKCFRGHGRLLLSKNKNAPVECATCHIDDDGDHFSCSWCAIRMCKYCRNDFADRGIRALRERIKTAELGSSNSENSSVESLVYHGRGLSSGSGVQFAY